MKVNWEIVMRLSFCFAASALLILTLTAQAASGPVLQYNFDEGTGTVAHDSSGNHNDGTLNNGPAWTTDGTKNALSFDGINDYLESTGFTWPGGSAVTVAFWNFAPNSTSIPDGYTFGIGTDQPFSGLVPHPNGTLYWDYGTNGRLTCSYGPYINKWTHVVLQSAGAGGNFRAIYLNGKLIVSSSTSDGPQNTMTDLQIGHNPAFAPNTRNSRTTIHDFRIYNRVLSAAEVLALAQVPPVATADVFSAPANQAEVIPAPGVLYNDSDLNGDTLQAILDTGTSHGNVTLNPNGSFTYTPSNGYIGDDSFTYHASDGTGVSSSVNVTLHVVDFSVTSLTPNHAPSGQKQTDVAISGSGLKPSPITFPSDIVSFHRHAYLYIPTAMSLPAATTYCQGLGGHVVSIGDAQENDFIAKMSPDNKLIGLSDSANEGTFVWSNGEPLVFTNWAIGQPDNFGNEDNVEMLGEGTWNDYNGAAEPTVCEFESQPTIVKFKNGATEIVATNVRVTSASQLLFDIDLTSAAIGTWDVLVVDPDNEGIATSVGGFTVTGFATTTVLTPPTPITYKTASQTITLKAQVTSPAGTLNSGTVTFQIGTGANSLVSVTSGTLVNGSTGNVNLTIPAGASVGAYSILATYNPPASFSSSVDSSQTLTINPAALTVTANNATREYAAAEPQFSGTLNGVLAGDLITATYTTSATILSSVGPYAITPVLVDPNNRLSNYTVNSTNGNLTITKVPLSASAMNASRNYGDPNPALSGELQGVRNNDNIVATYSTDATPASAIGQYVIVTTFADPDSKLLNYSSAVTNGTLTINTAPLSIAAANATRPFGFDNPVLTGIITGIKNNDTISATYSTDAQLDSPSGNYVITPLVSAPNGILSNYQVSLANGTLMIGSAIAPTFTSPANATGVVGAVFAINVSATGSAPITFGVDSLPQGLNLDGSVISGTPTATGAFNVTLTASNAGGTVAQVVTLIISKNSGVNHAPIFTSPVTASSNPAFTAIPVSFSASADDLDGDALIYTWNFGDGTSGSGQTVTKTYSVPGVYTVKVITTDGESEVTQSLNLVVDMEVESAALTIKKVNLAFNFATSGNDSLAISGNVPLIPAVDPVGKSVQILIGGIARTYVLKKAGVSDSKEFTWRPKKDGNSADFMFSLKNQNLFASLVDLGFTKTQNVAKLTFPIVLSFDTKNYLAQPILSYKVKASKKGPIRGTAK